MSLKPDQRPAGSSPSLHALVALVSTPCLTGWYHPQMGKHINAVSPMAACLAPSDAMNAGRKLPAHFLDDFSKYLKYVLSSDTLKTLVSVYNYIMEYSELPI